LTNFWNFKCSQRSIEHCEFNQLTRLQACLKDIKTWMTCNFLLLNSDKIEVLGPKHLRLSNDTAIMDGINMASSNTIRKLGVLFDQDLSFNNIGLGNFLTISPVLSLKNKN